MLWGSKRDRPDWNTLGADAYRRGLPVNDGPRGHRAYSAWCAGYYRAQSDDAERARAEADGRECRDLTLRMAPQLLDGMPSAVAAGRAQQLIWQATEEPERADTYQRLADAYRAQSHMPDDDTPTRPDTAQALDTTALGHPYAYPSPSLLTTGTRDTLAVDTVQGETLQRTLDSFKVAATVTGHTVGPMVTRWETELAPGVRVEKVTRLQSQFAYALGDSRIRVIAPIPGRSAIGVEVPNSDRALVRLSDVLQPAGHPLDVALGRGIDGDTVSMRIDRMPHLLVAGSTGSGKSAFINGVLVSLLMRASPDDVRLLLIDPKQVELTPYATVPHLAAPIVTEPAAAAKALASLVETMEARYKSLSAAGVRHIDDWNRRRPGERMPYIVCVIDELADLMMVARHEAEANIVRIAQKARAVGIHLILATQRPSADVVTGLIKANVPSRLVFTVASQTDSRVALDRNGAELLTGTGDGLFLPIGTMTPTRLQGALVTDEEVAAVVAAAR